MLAPRLTATLIALGLWGCDTRASDLGTRADQAARRAAEYTADEVDATTRLKVAEQRIARLERQVAELQAAPTAVDNDLLKQRLGATEAALYARTQSRGDQQPAPTSTPSPTPSTAATPRPRALATPSPQPTPAAAPRLKLVDPKEFDPRTGAKDTK